MEKNMGNVDKIVRIIIAIIIAYLYYSEKITGTLGLVLLVLAVVFVLTSFIGFCPLYKIFGFKTFIDKNK